MWLLYLVLWFYVPIFCLFAMIIQKSAWLGELDAKAASHPDEELDAATIRHHCPLKVEFDQGRTRRRHDEGVDLMLML